MSRCERGEWAAEALRALPSSREQSRLGCSKSPFPIELKVETSELQESKSFATFAFTAWLFRCIILSRLGQSSLVSGTQTMSLDEAVELGAPFRPAQATWIAEHFVLVSLKALDAAFVPS